jgi:hypothetical protein
MERNFLVNGTKHLLKNLKLNNLLLSGLFLLVGVVGYGQANALSVVLSDSDLIIGETSLVTITFDVPVQVGSFTEDDITIPNGTFTIGLSTSDNIIFTATYTPNAGVEGPTNVITVNNTGVADTGGTPGVGTTDSGNFTIDTLAPTSTVTINDASLIIGETATVTIVFSEAVQPGSFTNADLGAIPNGTLTAVSSGQL